MKAPSADFGYAYFVVRVRRPAREAAPRDAVGGVVERLNTGEKRAFSTTAERVETLGAWVADRPAQP